MSKCYGMQCDGFLIGSSRPYLAPGNLEIHHCLHENSEEKLAKVEDDAMGPPIFKLASHFNPFKTFLVLALVV